MPRLTPALPSDRARLTQIFRGQFHGRDFAKPHQVTVATATDHQLAKIIGRAHAGVGAQSELTFQRFDTSGRQLDVFLPQRLFDVLNRQLACAHRLAIQPHPHRIAALAADSDGRNAGHHREPINQVAFGVIRQLERRACVARQVEPHHGFGRRIDLCYLRLLGLIRQRLHDARDAIAHVIRRRLDIAIETEFDGDAGALIEAGRTQRLHTFQAGDLVLDHLRDLRLDDRGGRASINRIDADNRRLHVRRFSHRQASERHQSDDGQQQADHHREYRPTDGDFRKNHDAGFAAVAGSAHRRAVVNVHRAVDDDQLFSDNASENFHFAGTTAAQLNFALACVRFLDDEHEVLAVFGNDGAFPAASAPCPRSAPAATS